MSSMRVGDGRESASATLMRRWQVGLNVALLLAAVALVLWLARRALFLVFLVPVTFVPFSYARIRMHRVLEQMRCRSGTLRLLTAGGIILDVVMVAQLLTSRAAPAIPILHGLWMAWLGPVWFSTHSLFFCGCAVLALVRACGRVLSRLRQSVGFWRAPSAAPVSPGRRLFLQQAAALGAGLPFALSVSSVPLSYDFRVEEREIALPHWPPELDGLRVVHLSDIHAGGTMNRERLLRVAALTNGCRPDLVLHTGDFLTHRSGNFDAPLYEALAKIRAPYGQWACLGNHDYDDVQRLVSRLEQAGVVVLRNSCATVSVAGREMEIGGVDFFFRREASVSPYARVVDAWKPRSGAPRVVLIHDPRAFAALRDRCADLVLSGHTHGGHVGIQLGPSTAVTVAGLVGFPDQGIFERGDLRLFVTRCVGFYGYPMRIGIPPEIALLILRAGRIRHV